MDVGTLTGCGALGLSLVAFVVERACARAKRLVGLEVRVNVVETKLEPLWKDVSFAAVQAAASLLHSPDNELGLDEFIDRMREGMLTAVERAEFIRLLRAVCETGPTAGKRHAADVLLREQLRHA